MYRILKTLYLRLNIDHKNPYSTFYPQSMYKPDKVLGYAYVPGSYITHTKKNNFYSKVSTIKWHTTIKKNGNRITSFTPEIYNQNEEIWIFGDSFIFGSCNNDETSFPYILQQLLHTYKVRNYAGLGYGNTQGYLQIKRNLQKKEKLPSFIVLGYARYYNERNIASTNYVPFTLSVHNRIHNKQYNVNDILTQEQT